MERYGQEVPSRQQMSQQRKQLARAAALAKTDAAVRLHSLETVMEVTQGIDVGTYPRLVKGSPKSDGYEIRGVS